jgi:hypothetical protein
MCRIVMIIAIFIMASSIKAQQNYIDFDLINSVKLNYKSGRIDTKAKNPAPNEVNSSERCAKYIRTANVEYDNIKFQFIRKLENVVNFASYDENAPKLKMKVYTSAPPGTIIELQLGKVTHLDYPMSVHSQYQAITTKQNEWEELEFGFTISPKGSVVKPNEINQLIILFAPGTKVSEKFYFDEIIGPVMVGENITSSGKKK